MSHGIGSAAMTFLLAGDTPFYFFTCLAFATVLTHADLPLSSRRSLSLHCTHPFLQPFWLAFMGVNAGNHGIIAVSFCLLVLSSYLLGHILGFFLRDSLLV
jgi:flagellar biosynthesis protein FliR